jgi:hypothetical protein
MGMHSKVEEMLESYLMDYNKLVTRIDKLRADLSSTEELVGRLPFLFMPYGYDLACFPQIATQVFPSNNACYLLLSSCINHMSS